MFHLDQSQLDGHEKRYGATFISAAKFQWLLEIAQWKHECLPRLTHVIITELLGYSCNEEARPLEERVTWNFPKKLKQDFDEAGLTLEIRLVKNNNYNTGYQVYLSEPTQMEPKIDLNPFGEHQLAMFTAAARSALRKGANQFDLWPRVKTVADVQQILKILRAKEEMVDPEDLEGSQALLSPLW